MKFIDEYRDKTLAKRLLSKIQASIKDREYRLMEFCGGHTHAIFRFGINTLLPDRIRMIHGPGCPVCVLPVGRLDMALELACEKRVILCSYGDMLRVPGSGKRSLASLKAGGADIRMVLSSLDALRIAAENPGREIVFFAIGFETTTPQTAAAILEAEKLGIQNFSVFVNHVLTPSAVQNILESEGVQKMGSVRLDGFIGPGHVSAVIGTEPFEFFASEYAKPVVISGFEPADILLSVLMLINQVNDGRHEVENAYARAVTREGNPVAKKVVSEVFELRPLFEWRSLGRVPYSALRIKKRYEGFDSEKRFCMEEISSPDIQGCECGSVLRGMKIPTECRMFGSSCTPENPIGSCMVSQEGACAAYYAYVLRKHD